MVQFHVPEMTCGGCANRIGRALAQAGLPAHLQLEIDVAARQVRVPVPADSEVARAVQDALELAGYTAAVVQGAPPANASANPGGCCCAPRRPKPLM